METTIRALISEWYGVEDMPMTIRTREQEIADFQQAHPEVPLPLWEYVNHAVRLVRMWARVDLCLELVVWNDESQSYRLVQDLCFKDAYPSVLEWYSAIAEIVRDPTRKVWVVQHDQ
jgi:hypothetical protein